MVSPSSRFSSSQSTLLREVSGGQNEVETSSSGHVQQQQGHLSSWKFSMKFGAVMAVVFLAGIMNVRTSFQIVSTITGGGISSRSLEYLHYVEPATVYHNNTWREGENSDSTNTVTLRGQVTTESLAVATVTTTTEEALSRSSSVQATESEKNRRHKRVVAKKVPFFNKTLLDETKPWDNPSTWKYVSHKTYNHLVRNAKKDLQHQIDNYVDTNCKIHLIVTNNSNIQGKRTPPSPPKPVQLKFECLFENDENSSGANNQVVLQDEPCHSANSSIANVCLVVTNDENQQQNDDKRHTSPNKKKSALLMLVDSVEYLWKDEVTKGSNFTYWKSFLNKASYARRTDRPFFIWIGHIPQVELNSRKNNLDIFNMLGASCQPRESGNKMHYYKPLLVESVLQKQTQTGRLDSVMFLDADNSFTNEAFRPRRQQYFTGPQNNGRQTVENTDRLLGPEDYLALSPQATIMGSQNTNGGILMNGGLLILRNTPMLRDFNALWWYYRCGNKDQRGLWMVLLTIWSAATSNSRRSSTSLSSNTASSPPFGFPSIMFLNYYFANGITLTHVRKHVYDIQQRWNELTSLQLLADNTPQQDAKSSTRGIDRFLPQSYNTTLFDGGKLVVKGYLTAPLELPHVLLLPLTSWVHDKSQRRTNDGTTESMIHLPGLKAEIYDDEKEPFIIHKKRYNDVCRQGKCVPWFEE